MDAASGSFKYSDAVELRLVPSRIAALGLVLAGTGTIAVLLQLPLSPVWHWAALAGVLGLTGEALLTVAARRSRWGVHGMRLDRWGAITVRAGGTFRSGLVQPRSFVAPWLTIVRWRPEGARFDRTFVVLPDMADAEGFRRVRVLLKWGETGARKN
ncbi:hypothetical protein DSM104443_00954 [Usitatibacter rugosus]|uniref:Toxin CptA n=1 Tax=Usitatibacter rugosus TaxID=2732067 RepID=A0A6M4GU92_9PROT|nr:protein YgfX [Usitatibacter rugosus]QJR09903.1 hypothetical protein DSM104443_00954 [Usitatibacter rugosus]